MTGPGRQILVIGRSGQLACALAELSGRSKWTYTCIGRPDLDILDPISIETAIADIRPVAVINASAYTAVDKAESEPAAAMALNAQGPGGLAGLCKEHKLPLVHVSTDYVFSGSASSPWRPDDPIEPGSVYGKSKAAGETAVRTNHDQHLIIRTSWVFGPEGNNFLKTMLRLANERETVAVVDDQTGAPTYAPDLAGGLDAVLGKILAPQGFDGWGTYHLTNSGQTTWHGFAAEIFRQASLAGLKVPNLNAIPGSQYPTDAARPAYSVLDTSVTRQLFGITMPDWQDAVRRCLQLITARDQPEQEGKCS